MLAVLVAASVPRPAQAQDLGTPPNYGPLPWLIGAGLVLYVVGGGATIVAADASYATKRRPLPLGWAVAQGVYGASYMATGLIALQEEEKTPAIVLLAIGTTVAAYPVLDWRIHAGRRTVQASLRLTPGGVVANGNF